MSRIIEDKIPIAADAAETLGAFLEELTIKLVKKGSQNAYSLASEVEIMIIDKLREMGRETKLTTDELMQVIDEIGTPDDLIKEYQISREENFYTESDPLVPEEHQNRLIKRTKAGDGPGVMKKTGFFFTDLIRVAIAAVPAFFFALALTPLIFFREDMIYAYEFFFPFFGVGMGIFVAKELGSGLTGRTILGYKHSRIKRYIERGLYTSFFLFTLFVVRRAEGYFNYYYSYTNYLEIVVPLVIAAEVVVFLRDHLVRLYPLEPNFRPAIRVLNPSYILLGFAIIMYLLAWTVSDDIDDGLGFFISILVVIAVIITRIKKPPVTPRYYIISGYMLLSLLSFGDYDSVIFTVFSILALSFFLFFHYIHQNRQNIRNSMSDFSSRAKESYQDFNK